MKIHTQYLAMFLMLLLASAERHAYAQEAGGRGPSTAQGQVAPEAVQETNDTAVSGSNIYVVDRVDNQIRLATINADTFAVKVIGPTRTSLTGIGFAPDHHLYGVSSSSLFMIDRSDGHAKFIGDLGIKDAIGLAFNSSGTAFTAAANCDELYKVDVSTGKAISIGRTDGIRSAGGLAFYTYAHQDLLLLSGKAISGEDHSKDKDTGSYLVALNETTGNVIGKAMQLNAKEVLGLVRNKNNELFGFGLTGANNEPALFRFFPEKPRKDRESLLKSLAESGLGQIYGAAYEDSFVAP